MQPVIDPNPGVAASALPATTIIEQIEARREELTRNLGSATNAPSTRAAIEGALAALASLLTGDLVTIPEMVTRDLSRWLEQSRYLGISAATTAAVAPQPAATTAASEVTAAVVDEVAAAAEPASLPAS